MTEEIMSAVNGENEVFVRLRVGACTQCAICELLHERSAEPLLLAYGVICITIDRTKKRV